MWTVSGRTAIKILIHLYDTKNQHYALITYTEHTQLKMVWEGIWIKSSNCQTCKLSKSRGFV